MSCQTAVDGSPADRVTIVANRTEESFAAIESGIDDMLALTVENARLRALLATARPVQPKPLLSPRQGELAAVRVDLAIAQAARAEAERKLAEQRDELAQQSSTSSSTEADDLRKELDVVKTSLASIASELEAERERASEIAALYRQEQAKVSFLQQQIDELRRPLPGNARRPSIDAASVRRVSLFDSTPRRRSSLGPLGQAIANPPVPINGIGLGLGVDSPSTNVMSTSPIGKPTPLHRLAQRRASLGLGLDREEDDRTSKIRDLRLGTSYLKVASRRGSLATSGLPDFSSADDFNFEYDRRRRLSSASYRHGSISEEGVSSPSRPPSAPLRANRKNSMAVFESWSRRSSTDSSNMGGYNGPFYLDDEAEDDINDINDPTELKLRLEGLKIALAESEEGRRASELCLRALKDFIAQRDDSTVGLSLPPLPSQGSVDDMVAPPAPRNRASFARWSIPRLSFGSRSGSPAPSMTQESPSLTTCTRRPSNVSTNSNQTSTPFTLGRPAPQASTASAPIFGAFSFAALAPASTLVDGDTSPRMSGPSPSNPEGVPAFTAAPQEEDDDGEAVEGPLDHLSSPTSESHMSIAQTPCSEAPSLSNCSTSSSRSTSPGPHNKGEEDDEPAHAKGLFGLDQRRTTVTALEYEEALSLDLLDCELEGEPRIVVAESLTFSKTTPPSLRPSPSLKRRSGLSSAFAKKNGAAGFDPTQGVLAANKALNEVLT
ncbi:hypothetical protein OIO90_003086 [Microbotryomycetes sp. JL221]|nr:hypothetical protein OIO90_003086 [Microbotryomycetes sp. JL221]